MVDSRAKGARGEYKVRDTLREATGLQFERVPASGALAYMKGDLHIPDKICKYLIEVKNYADSPLNDKIFTNKSNNLVKWWEKAVEQASYKDQKPLVIFKYNRSKLFVVVPDMPENTENFMYISWLDCCVLLLDEWLKCESIEWV